MKRLQLLITAFLFWQVSDTCGQARVNETREKLQIEIVEQSEKLEKVTGWVLSDEAEGKIWRKSQKSNVSYIPFQGEAEILRTAEYQQFTFIQFYKMALEGELFYFAVIRYPGPDNYSIYFFDNLDMVKLQNIIKNEDGDYVKALTVKYCFDSNSYTHPMFLYFEEQKKLTKYEGFIPDYILKDKDMIRALVLRERINNDIDRLTGHPIFYVSSQIIENEKIVRFIVIPGRISGIYEPRNLWKKGIANAPIIDKNDMGYYFETSRTEFSKLFNFQSYISPLVIEEKEREANIREKEEKEREAIREKEAIIERQKIEYTGEYKFKTTFNSLLDEISLYSDATPNPDEVIYKCPQSSTVYVIDNTKSIFKVFVDGYTGYLFSGSLNRKE